MHGPVFSLRTSAGNLSAKCLGSCFFFLSLFIWRSLFGLERRVKLASGVARLHLIKTLPGVWKTTPFLKMLLLREEMESVDSGESGH